MGYGVWPLGRQSPIPESPSIFPLLAEADFRTKEQLEWATGT